MTVYNNIAASDLQSMTFVDWLSFDFVVYFRARSPEGPMNPGNMNCKTSITLNQITDLTNAN